MGLRLQAAVLTSALLLTSCGDPLVQGLTPGGSLSEDSGPGSGTDTGTDPVDVGEQLSPMRLLFRASLDLRGVRPSLDEIEAVRADPEAVDALIVGFLDDPRFAERLVHLYDERFQTRTDVLVVRYDTDDPLLLAKPIGEEPLRVLAQVISQDLAYTELVTADWTMANEKLGTIWPVDYPEGETGWQVVQYTDHRPGAGVLSSNGLWDRYGSTESNANRGRANVLSRILLCSDYLDRSIEFDRDVELLDEEAVRDALHNNPGCVACHATLDPLASHLWGFYYVNQTSPLDAGAYHPERELFWEDTTGTAPGYFGEPTLTLDDLGEQVAADSRFVECAVSTAFELMLQRRHGIDDLDTLTALRETLLAEELRMRPVFAELIGGRHYRSADEATGGTPWKITRPDVLASQLEDLTGYRFTYNGRDMLDNDTVGLRSLAGGMDGTYVTVPAAEINTMSWLVVERMAQAAASYAVTSDIADPEAARLFTEVDFTEHPDSDPEPMIAQLQLLHLRLTGTEHAADSEVIAADLTLWSELYAIDEDPEAAWAGVLSVRLRDPEVLFY